MNENCKQKEIIKDALEEAEYLLSDEYQSLTDEELRKEYDRVLKKIQKTKNMV